MTQSTLHKILVISPNWVGDAIMAQPLLSVLKESYPNSLIDVLAPKWVSPVWQAMREVNEVIATNLKHGQLQLGERWKIAKQLKETHYDEAYVLPNSLKFALIPWFAGIVRRVGYLGEKRYGLLNVIHRDEKDHPRAMVPFYAALANEPKADVPLVENLPRPHMYVLPEALDALKRKLAINWSKRIVAFAPGAEFGVAKRWPTNHFIDLAKMIVKDYSDVLIVLMGSANDQTACLPIAKEVPEIVNLAGQTTLSEAITLLSQVDLLVTNDSGLMHVASAFDKPVVAIYGSTDYTHTPPTSPLAEIVSLDLPCAPCQKRQCPLGHHNCMQQLNASLVFKAVQKHLGVSVR